MRKERVNKWPNSMTDIYDDNDDNDNDDDDVLEEGCKKIKTQILG